MSSEKYDLEKAVSEAESLKLKIESGIVGSYSEAETIVDVENELERQNNFWNVFAEDRRQLEDYAGGKTMSDAFDGGKCPQNVSDLRWGQTRNEFIETVDNMALEVGANLDEIKKLCSEISKCRTKGVMLGSSGREDEASKFYLEEDKLRMKVVLMLKPVYNKLLDLGYKPADLSL